MGNMKFYSFDLDIDPITLVLKSDLDIIKMSVCAENEVPSSDGSMVNSVADPVFPRGGTNTRGGAISIKNEEILA